MFKNLKLAKKIGGGFGLVLLLTALVGYIGYGSLADVADYSHRLTNVNHTIDNVTAARLNFLKYCSEKQQKYLDSTFESLESVDKNAGKTLDLLTHKDDIEQLKTVKGLGQKYDTILKQYVVALQKEEEIGKRRTAVRGELNDALKELLAVQARNEAAAEEQLQAEIKDRTWKSNIIGKKLVESLGAMRIASLKYSYDLNPEMMKEAKRASRDGQAICAELLPKFKNKQNRELITEVSDGLEEYEKVTAGYACKETDPAKYSELQKRAGVIGAKITHDCDTLVELQDKNLHEYQEFAAKERVRRKYNRDLIRGIAGVMSGVRGDLFKYIAYQGKDLRAIVDNKISGAIKNGEELQDRYANNANLPKVTAAVTSMKEYHKAFSEFADSMEYRLEKVDEMGVIGGSATAEAGKAVDSQNTQMASTISNANWTITAGALLAIGIGIGLSIFIANSITRPVSRMADGLALVADGDLTAQVAVDSKDEIGMMAEALNDTVSNLCRIVGEIREAADQTAASGEELSAAAQNISSGAQQQASSVEEIAASVEELTASINQVSQNAQQANDVSVETTQVAESGGKTVSQSIDGMRLINESSTQISKIIDVISQIANQTNLLALNAAIEAASAGEHGLGFAVVADEVRKLAERSSQAAQEITQLIEESTKRVDDGSRLSQEVGKSLDEILAGIENTAKGMRQISTGTDEQATTANEVSKAIEGISAVTEENSSSAEEMAASAEELSAQAQRMQGLVERFKLDKVQGASKSASAVTEKAKVPAETKAAPKAADFDTEGMAGALYHA